MADTVCMRTVVKHLVDGTLNESLCRICLLPLSEVCENIFTKIGKLGKEYCVADVLEILHVKFSETDRFSVCSECFVSASVAYKLYLKLHRSNEILNYYVDELQKNIDSIDTPINDYNDSLCVTLQDYVPDIHNFAYDIGNLFTKETKMSFGHDRYDDVETKRELNILMKEPKPIKSKIKETGTSDAIKDKDQDEDLIIVVSGNRDKISYMKLMDNTSPKVKEKISRKRNPMPFMKCSRCDVHYRFIAKMKVHMKLEHNVDLFVCKVCKSTTESKDEFTEHLRTHSNVHHCGLCGSVFKKRDTMVAHLRWHDEVLSLSQREGAHVCESCGIILPNEEELKDHYDKKHDKKYTCYYCGKMYKGERSFEVHIQKHELHMSPEKRKHAAKKPTVNAGASPSGGNQRRRLMCDTCGREFRDERGLRWHSMLHTDVRPYTCNVCGRGFVSLNRRNQHAVCAHTAPARRCPLCPALFHLRSMVNSHIKKVHLKEHKRRNRTSKHQHVSWRTRPVPIQELSVSIQNGLLELKASGDVNSGKITSATTAPASTRCGPSPYRS